VCIEGSAKCYCGRRSTTETTINRRQESNVTLFLLAACLATGMSFSLVVCSLHVYVPAEDVQAAESHCQNFFQIC
jgi:hypothetical protein